jgi:hypothetical protein
MSDKITINTHDWGIKQKIERNGKMKIAFKLNKEESEGYKAWAQVVKPAEVAEDDFVKSIFLQGIVSINEHAKNLVEREVAKKKLEQQKLESATPVVYSGNEQPKV